MGKEIFTTLFLLLVSMNTAFASLSSTVIRSYTGNPVQCNKWGWVYGNTQTVWYNGCTPLEVQSSDGSKSFQIKTTEDQCGDYEFAVYEFNEGDNDIHFTGCYDYKHLNPRPIKK